MTTHRLIQIHNLLDNAESKAACATRAASNLARIGNSIGSQYYTSKAIRLYHLVDKLKERLNAA